MPLSKESYFSECSSKEKWISWEGNLKIFNSGIIYPLKSLSMLHETIFSLKSDSSSVVIILLLTMLDCGIAFGN